MKKLLVLLGILVLALGAGCSAKQDVKPTAKTPPLATGDNKQSDQTSAKVKVFLIAIDDNGKSGKKLGTGDSLVPVERTIANPKTPLTGALEELFSLKERIYGQSGLYNPLSQSDIKVNSVVIKDEKATIRLTGKLRLGGVLDDERVRVQITETALQFSTVKEVAVFLNDKKLEDVLSEKG